MGAHRTSEERTVVVRWRDLFDFTLETLEVVDAVKRGTAIPSGWAISVERFMDLEAYREWAAQITRELQGRFSLRARLA